MRHDRIEWQPEQTKYLDEIARKGNYTCKELAEKMAEKFPNVRWTYQRVRDKAKRRNLKIKRTKWRWTEEQVEYAKEQSAKGLTHRQVMEKMQERYPNRPWTMSQIQATVGESREKPGPRGNGIVVDEQQLAINRLVASLPMRGDGLMVTGYFGAILATEEDGEAGAEK